jgi:hypothetical protein
MQCIRAHVPSEVQRFHFPEPDHPRPAARESVHGAVSG